MAKELLPDALWLRIAPLIPPEAPKPKGARPRVSDRAALTGILFVLKIGHPTRENSQPGQSRIAPTKLGT